MPDIISKIGNTNTPLVMDYSTVQAWLTACPSDLSADGHRQIGEVYDQGVVTGNGDAGSRTTDTSNYLFLRAAAGASFRDKAGVRTTALTYNNTNGAAIEGTGVFNVTPFNTVSAPNSRLAGLQVSNPSGPGGNGPVSGVSLITDCILTGTGGGYGGVGETFQNCLILCAGAGMTGPSDVTALYNCTIINLGGGTSFGVEAFFRSPIVKNCAIFGFSTGMKVTSGGYAAGTDYNATDDASAIGAHSLKNLTFASQVVSTTTDFRAVITGALKAGTPDSTNAPDDISAFTRDATTPYIGAWEVPGGSPSSSVSPSLSPSASPSPSSSASPSVSPSASVSPSVSPSASVSPSSSQSASASSSASASPSPSPGGNSPSASPSVSPSASTSPSHSASASQSPSSSTSPSSSASRSASASLSPSSSASASPSPSPAENSGPDVDVIADSPKEITPGDLTEQDPAASLNYRFNWDRRNLPTDVTIDTANIDVTAVRPTTASVPTITRIRVSSDGRNVDFLCDARTAVLGATYRIACTIHTNEDPEPTKKLSFFLLIESL